MKTKFNVEVYLTEKIDKVNSLVKNKLKYALFPNDNAVTSSIIQGWQYEPYFFEFLKINCIETYGKDIVDVGANNGNFAVEFSHLAGDEGKVHSFEPQRIIYYQLCGNVFMNGLDNVYCHNVAIGDKQGITFIDKPNYLSLESVNFGNVSLKKQFDYNKTDIVDMKTLDEYDFNDVILIKIDVQGYEPNVIEGAKETIKKHRPYLFVEFEEHLLVENGSSEALLKKQIEDLGYIVKRFQEGIPYQTESGMCLDCVCIPIEKESLNHIIP
jgi:FkbM family methyltransferase